MPYHYLKYKKKWLTSSMHCICCSLVCFTSISSSRSKSLAFDPLHLLLFLLNLPLYSLSLLLPLSYDLSLSLKLLWSLLLYLHLLLLSLKLFLAQKVWSLLLSLLLRLYDLPLPYNLFLLFVLILDTTSWFLSKVTLYLDILLVWMACTAHSEKRAFLAQM